MAPRNEHFSTLKQSYLFVEIANRRKAFVAANPDVKLISLGIGDTTEELPQPIVAGLQEKVQGLGTREGYTGYPDYNGSEELRQLIVDQFYPGQGITKDEVFISDGSKPDLGRLQFLFSTSSTVALQDPVYPVYRDSSVITGKAGVAGHDDRYDKLVYMNCNPNNGFFPDLTDQKRTDLIYFCSPNNPTGAVATRDQLTALVQFAKKNKSLIIFDSAYSGFISDPAIPKSIYEIDGARDVAFETSSFSKIVGFTGVRLGWTVCPKTLMFSDGSSSPVITDWSRIMGTFFNGPSNIAEAGGIAALKPEGRASMKSLINHYMENAKIIRTAIEGLGFECHGGENCPYIWFRVPGRDSWDMFQELLEKAHVVTTPGVGFGSQGAEFVRISAFAHRDDVLEAVGRLQKALTK